MRLAIPASLFISSYIHSKSNFSTTLIVRQVVVSIKVNFIIQV